MKLLLLGDQFITDVAVNFVRRRIGHIGKQEAELSAGIEQSLAQCGDRRGRVAVIAELWRGVNQIHANAVGSLAGAGGNGNSLAINLPQSSGTGLDPPARAFDVSAGIRLADHSDEFSDELCDDVEIL